jgi:hypothetical protein
MNWIKIDINSFPMWTTYGKILDNQLFEIIGNDFIGFTLRTKIGNDFQNEIGRFATLEMANSAKLIDEGEIK